MEGCTFDNCKATGGMAGVICGELGTTSSGNIFQLKSILIIESTSSISSTTIPEAVYLNVPDRKNEEFLFDTITLSNQYSIETPVIYLNIYNLTDVTDGGSRLPEFKQKFVGFCVSKPNMTNFIVRDAKASKLYPLPTLICECEDRTASADGKNPCSYDNGNDKCLMDEDGKCIKDACTNSKFVTFNFPFF
jgi:hypothetical protein